jgi:hypothetical protein
MTRIYALLFALTLTLAACATVGPIAVKCGLQDISIAAADYAEIKAAYEAHDWPTLVKEAEKIGWATFDCVTADMVSKDSTLAPAREEFRREHAVEFRAAGVRA